MDLKSSRARKAGPLGVAVLLVAQLFVWGIPAAQSQGPGDPVDLKGFANGQALHLDALDVGPRIADLEVAWSGAAVGGGADGLAGVRQQNETEMPFQSGDSSKIAYTMADGAELGIGIDPPAGDTQLQLPDRVEADAPPSSSASENVLELPIDPLLFADVIRGEAVANTNDSGLLNELCIVGADIARGDSYVADLSLLDGNITAQLPASGDGEAQNVLQSTSRLKLIPSGVPGKFGLMAEMRQIYAPINIADSITLRVLGEWRLAAIATGQPGGARVEYGPVGATNTTPVLELNLAGSIIPINLEDITGPLAPILDPLTDALNDAGIADLSIGEQARALAAPGGSPDDDSSPVVSADGRSASGAADVVRLRLLPDILDLLDLRIGHMEVGVEVPEGGIECPIPVSKSADPTTIFLGGSPDTSNIQLTVHNAFDCDLTGVVLTDRIRPVNGTSPDFILSAADPTPDSPVIPTGTIKQADVVWTLGDIPMGETRTVSLDLTAAGSTAGILEDIAEAQASLENCEGEDVEGLALNGLDIGGLSVPVRVTVANVGEVEIPVTGAGATQTAAIGGLLALLALGGAVLLRRRFGAAA